MNIENMIVLAIALVISVMSDISTIKLIYNVIKGRVLLNKARNNGERIVRGISAVYRVHNYLFSMLLELFFIYIMIYFFRTFGSVSKFLSIFFIIEAITMAVLLVVHLTATFAEKYVYLTKDGLIYFLGRFDFDKCHYAWDAESQPDMLSNRLHVYKPNDNQPFTVYFEEQIEAEIAHKLIDKVTDASETGENI